MTLVSEPREGYESYRRSEETVRGRPVTEKWRKDGVRVTVRRNENGSTCEADCKCLGIGKGTHSNAACPAIPRRTA